MLGNPDYPTYQVFLSIGIAAVNFACAHAAFYSLDAA